MDYEEIKLKYTESELKEKWNTAIGLQDVDKLKPSEYLIELAQKNVQGKLSNTAIEELLYSHYENETLDDKVLRTKECDIVSNRIVELLAMDSFTFSPVTLKTIHKYLFNGIYEHAGEYRTYNIRKKEPILGGKTVNYANYNEIEEIYRYDFEIEKQQKYSALTEEQTIKRISEFTSSVWQVHPFGEGNTRTTAVFIERYLNSIGFDVNNESFKDNARYFRNALVRSNYADFKNKIDTDNSYINKFFENLLFNGRNELKSRDLVIVDTVADIELDR